MLRRKRLGLCRKQLAAVHVAALGQRLAALQRDHLLRLRGGGGREGAAQPGLGLGLGMEARPGEGPAPPAGHSLPSLPLPLLGSGTVASLLGLFLGQYLWRAPSSLVAIVSQLVRLLLRVVR